MSASSASGSTATVAALVWTRPPDSVSGTRCTRWTPLSNFMRAYALSPSMNRAHSRTPPNSVSLRFKNSVFQPRFCAYIKYMRKSECANNAPSSPPTPLLISSIAFLSSSGSLGSNSKRNSSHNSDCRAVCVSHSSRARSFSSGSENIRSASVFAAPASFHFLYASTSGDSSRSSRFRSRRRSASA